MFLQQLPIAYLSTNCLLMQVYKGEEKHIPNFFNLSRHTYIILGKQYNELIALQQIILYKKKLPNS